MHRVAQWFGRLARSFADGFRRVDKEPRWEVCIEFSQGAKRKIEVNKDTWEKLKRWMDFQDGAGSTMFTLETEGHSLRLVRDYVAIMEGRRR